MPFACRTRSTARPRRCSARRPRSRRTSSSSRNNPGMANRYTRQAPSPRYRRLIEQYQLMHTQGEVHLGIPPEQTFPGKSLPKQAPHIKRLVKRTGARTILDDGCGKGQQYRMHRIRDEDEGVEYADIKS